MNNPFQKASRSQVFLKLATRDKSLSRRTPIQNRIYQGSIPTDSGCWEWFRSIFPKSGYGSFFMDGKNHLAHRISYEAFNGPIPEGLLVRHICDNRKCVKPAHLLVGTHQDNMDDCVARGRTNHSVRQKGKDVGTAILTEEAVRGIKVALREGASCKEIAAHIGVDRTTISKIKCGKNWNHVS